MRENESNVDSGQPVPELVSVIVPSYNRRKVLCDCIDSVLAQDYGMIEIIAVDDNSRDGTVEYLSSHYRDVTVMASKRRYGPSHLRNRGLNAAKGSYVLFLDSDVVLHRTDIITKMVRRLRDDATIGQIGGEIPVYLGIFNEAHGRKIGYFGSNSVVVSRKEEGTGAERRECDYLATCNCMVRKEVALKVGGFDPYYQFGGEDADFGLAIRNCGYRNIVVYEVAALHRHEQTGRYPDEQYRYAMTSIRFNLRWNSRTRNAVIFLKDLSGALLFYLLLLPKIIVKVLTGQRLVSGNFTGGYYVLKAYAMTFLGSRRIRQTSRTTYLSTEAMNTFEAFLSPGS